MAEDAARRAAHEILAEVMSMGRDELARSRSGLFISGIAGGVTMGLTALGVAVMHSYLGYGPKQDVLSNLLYPIGFIAVIIGRGQLFTENTLFPVVLILDERGHVLNTLRLWLMVFLGNILGALLFAVVAIKTPSLKAEIANALAETAVHASAGTFTHIFWSGIIGGWLIALVAWMVTASHDTIGQVTITWLLTFLVGAGRFAHCIAGSAELLSGVLAHTVPAWQYLHWILAATLGNIVGGVVIVALLNWGQVTAGE